MAFARLDFADIIRLASHYTVQQFLVRENFAKRLEDEGKAIFLHEFFYALDASLRCSGARSRCTGWRAGPALSTSWWPDANYKPGLGQKPQIAIIMGESLPGTDGEIKMSKSLGNHIPLLSEPWDMFGKVMSLPDKAMGCLSTSSILGWTPAQVEALETGLALGRDPTPTRLK